MEPFRRELRWPLATEQNAGRMQGKLLPIQTAVHLGCAYKASAGFYWGSEEMTCVQGQRGQCAQSSTMAKGSIRCQ